GKRIATPAGQQLDLSQVPLSLTPEERQLGLSGLVVKYLGSALSAIGDPGTPDWPPGPAKSYDQITMAEFLREQGASAGAIELLEWPYATAEDDRASLLWILRETLYESHEKTRYKITGGPDSGKRRRRTALVYPTCHKRSGIRRSTSPAREDYWPLTCSAALRGGRVRWPTTSAWNSWRTSWRKCILGCWIIWREESPRCGTRTNGREVRTPCLPQAR